MLDIRREIKEKYPNPEKLSFPELLEREMNGENNKPVPAEDENGFILDIKSVQSGVYLQFHEAKCSLKL